MNKQRVYYYFLYGLLLGGIAGKLIGWITLTHNLFFDWITEGMILLFLLLEAKSIFNYFNPGIKVQRALDDEDTLFIADSNQGWLLVGILVRLLGIVFFSLGAAILLTSFRNTEYVFAAICIYLAVILLVGIVFYIRKNPYALLIDDEGIMVYFFSFKQVKWENLTKVNIKPQWVALHPEGRAVNEIEFENLNCDKQSLIETLRAQTIIRTIPFSDNSKEFTPEIWE
jgi:hypothetical protein